MTFRFVHYPAFYTSLIYTHNEDKLKHAELNDSQNRSSFVNSFVFYSNRDRYMLNEMIDKIVKYNFPFYPPPLTP